MKSQRVALHALFVIYWQGMRQEELWILLLTLITLECVTFNKSTSTFWAHLANQAGEPDHPQDPFQLQDAITIFLQGPSYSMDSLSRYAFM